jgi:hypothetical protein
MPQQENLSVETVIFDGNNFEEIAKFTGFHKNASTGDDINNFNRIGTYLVQENSDELAELWVTCINKWLPIRPGDTIVKHDELGLLRRSRRFSARP